MHGSVKLYTQMHKKRHRSGTFGLRQSKPAYGAMTKIKDSIQATSNKPKEKYQVKNWSTYNNALVSRGSITLWLSEEVISSWYYQGARQPGGAVKYSEACMICLLSIKSLFRLGFNIAYRDTRYNFLNI